MSVSLLPPTGSVGHGTPSHSRSPSSIALGRIMAIVENQSPLRTKEVDIGRILDETLLQPSSSTEAAELNELISQLEADHAELIQKIENQRREHLALTNKYNALQQKTGEQESESTILRNKYSDVVKENTELKGETERLKTQYHDLRSAYDPLKATCADLTARNSTLTSQALALESRCATMAGTLQSLETEKKESKEMAGELNESLSRLKDRHNTLTENTKKLRSEYEHLSNEYHQLKKRFDAIVANNAPIQARKSEAFSEVLAGSWQTMRERVWLTTRPFRQAVQLSKGFGQWALTKIGESR